MREPKGRDDRCDKKESRERQWDLLCKSVNWVGQCTKHELFFPKIHFFFIL